MSPPRALIKERESLSMLYLSLSESGGDQTRAERRVNVGLDTAWRCSSVSAVGPSQVIISWHRQNRFLSWEYVRAVSFSPLRIRCIYADLIAKRIMGGFWNKSCRTGHCRASWWPSSFYCLWQWLYGFMTRVTKHNTNVLEIMTDTLINLKVHEIKSCYFRLKNILCNLSLEAHTPSRPDDWAVMSSAPWRSRCRRPWTKPCHCIQRGHSAQTEPWVGLGCVCVWCMFLIIFYCSDFLAETEQPGDFEYQSLVIETSLENHLYF